MAPGNGGTAITDKYDNVDITDINELLTFAKKNNIDLTIVGPDKRGAELEGSKSYSKDFMKKYGVKTAEYEVFYESDKALDYLENCAYPIVIKADGLAAGKGVAICKTMEEDRETIKSYMIEDIFKGAGAKVVIEEFLEGVEASILSITDGKTIIPFLSAKDHKQIFDGGKGPNTGGMGVLAPNPYVTDEVQKEFEENIMAKTLKGIQEEGYDFKGIIFFGLMITKKGTYLLEYNVRMGNPETQSVLYLMESDLLEVIEAAMDEKLADLEIKWNKGTCVNVVLASKGYPGEFVKGYEIKRRITVKDKVFLAGAKAEGGMLKTSGGRVLSVLVVGATVDEAREDAYKNTDGVEFGGMYFRNDIGLVQDYKNINI